MMMLLLLSETVTAPGPEPEPEEPDQDKNELQLIVDAESFIGKEVYKRFIHEVYREALRTYAQRFGRY